MIAMEENAKREKVAAGPFIIPRDFCIRLTITPSNREDAWDLCGLVERCGGVEVSDGCFAFDTEQRRIFALESLRTQFGPTYFEAVARCDAKPQFTET